MSQMAKVLAAKPKYLSSVPEAHMVAEENQLLQLSSDLHTNIGVQLLLLLFK